jgi:RND family efflux transporter MFP subunit
MERDMETNERPNMVTKEGPMLWGINLKRVGFRAVLCLIIIVFGLISAKYLIHSAPRANRRPPVKMTPLVKVEPIYPATHRVVISATGTVIPARDMVLKSRVNGEVVKIHPDFVEGGVVVKGTEVLRIDDTDYKLAVAQKQTAVVNARYALKLESGHQEVAKREWDLLNGDKPASEGDAELALRRPHLEKAESDLRAAEAELEQAKLDLARTRIRAPFDAMIRAAHVEIGSQVTTQESLAELVGTEAYWIKASVPVDHLRWIALPRDSRGRGARVKVYHQDNGQRTGMVVRLLGDLETEGRMARVLISVKDPLGLKTPKEGFLPLLIGEYVQVAIEGQELQGAYRIPRTALRDRTHVWIVGKDKTLQILKVETVWRDRDSVFLQNGFNPGDLLVVSDLSTPVAGMPLKVEKETPNTPPSEAGKPQSEKG